MRYLVAIDGRVARDPTEAVVSVTDRGLLYGDSVYEVIRTYGGRPFALEAHIERLGRSAAAIEIAIPWSAEQLAEEARELFALAGGVGDKGLRLIVTRGSGPLGLDPALAERPRRIAIVFDVPSLPEGGRKDGVAVSLLETGRVAGGSGPGGVKTGNYLTNVMALGRAREAGSYEAIMVNGAGRLTEGTSCNFFIFSRGALRTPPLERGVLDGITRRVVLDLGESAGILVSEEDLHPLDLYSAGEVFLTSTLKEILPVTRVDDVVIGDGIAGPVTTRLRYLFDSFVRGM